jgi:energy-coupling factor transporter ATP-binding protein EcfA2
LHRKGHLYYVADRRTPSRLRPGATMILRSIDFIQSENKPMEWRLEGLTLRPINLIVGQNASGKTKALEAIRGLSRLVSGKSRPSRWPNENASYSAVLSDEERASEIRYMLKIADSRVCKESLTIGGMTMVERGEGGAGRIYFKKLDSFLDFQAPESDLACVSRRDSIQHPYLDELYTWGRLSLFYRFNSRDLGKHTLVSIEFRETPEQDAPGEDNFDFHAPVQAIYRPGVEEFQEGFRASILEDMQSLGYQLGDVGLRVVGKVAPRGSASGDDEKEYNCLYVTEGGLLGPIEQRAMSDGMFRALSILICVTYATMKARPSCLIIDDIGEGLDHERSCRLIKLLIQKAQKTGVQLVMATNDRFVMNNVPLEYWTVLAREPTERGTRVKVYNYETHKNVFDDFAYTGLNNFDFFATRFFEEGLDDRE